MKKLMPLLFKPFYKLLYPKIVWNFSRNEKNIYLTFDDGPIPELTEWILDELDKFNAKATFFCVGSNIINNPSIFEKIIKSGHAVANHSMNHLKGFKLNIEEFMQNAEECEILIKNKYFRPPFGQMTPAQYKAIVEKNFQIIYWDVFSGDYLEISPQECAKTVIKKTRNGSIVLFHDNLKSESNLRHALPIVLKHFSEQNYNFVKIEL
ncbi:MAG: polysaccharide deacetylase family protein [Bacteriovorax sp.]